MASKNISTWRKSETNVGKDYSVYQSRASYKDGNEVDDGLKDSSRSMYYSTNHSVEVKKI